MDDVSKLGPLWVSQLTKEVAEHRNRAAESLMTVKPEGAYADQHRMLIDTANTMLAAPVLLDALKLIAAEAAEGAGSTGTAGWMGAIARVAIAKATGSAA